MATSTVEPEVPGATALAVTGDTLTAELADGRTISVALACRWELHAAGQHIHWPDLDEDLSVEGLLAGRPSGEGRESFGRWLEAKRAGRPLTLDALFADDED